MSRLTTIVCFVFGVGTAWGQAAAGVSDERVNLPNAPGSIAGVGENATVSGNQGALNYSVKVEVPQGFPGVTPDLAFSYSSSGGSDVLGMGWSMPSFAIERMTSKGLQHYDVDDRFVAEGSDELVRVSQAGTSAVYRSRFESGFVRYTWLNRGTGDAGSWKAEYPDGRVGYFGADDAGVAVTSAQVRVPTTTKVFRWHLVMMVDRFGHRMQASWTKDPGGASLLDRLDYLYDAGQPRHSVRFVYETRPDVISDAKPGFELKLTQRLKEVRIFSGAELIRGYALAFEADAIAGGASRLSRVTRAGRSAGTYPVAFNFGYSKTLGGTCTGADCAKPFVKNMGSLGVDFSQGRATLLDINGDALPDVLSSSASGLHSFYLAKLDAEGQVSFATTPVPSARTVGSSSLILGNATVQVIDLNGDGFVDITNPRSGEVLCNKGGGDWTAAPTDCKPTASAVSASYALDEDVGDPLQADPLHIRFFDFDNDKRIDFLKTDPGGTTSILANTTAGYVAASADTIGEVFDDTALQLADMNGDGLQDPVILRVSGNAVQLSYKLNFGFGIWSAWHDVTVTGFDPSQIAVLELQDINGDELTDLVAVVGNEIKLSLNRNSDRFDAVRTIATADLGAGTIPSRTGSTIVSFADMNGNGSSDIVWIEAGGAISYLELFPVRPNLLSRIDNGVGAVQRFSYGTSILEQARDELATQPWLNKVPNPMTLVTSMESFVTLTGSDMGGTMSPTGLRERTLFRYHSGFYDGVEKQFRGYEGVERQMDSDMSRDAQEPGLTVESYDVGKTDPLLAGRPLISQMWAGAAPNRALLTETRSLWQACMVAQSSNTFFACERGTTTILTERDAAHAVTTREERDYDGYGNVTASRELGVVNLGTPEQPRGCAPCVASGTFGDACGDQCMGDEAFSETDFIDPGTTASANLWLSGQPKEERSAAVAGAWEQITRTYYDGADFVGRTLGELTLGNVTRAERKLGDAFVTVARSRIDAHGNSIETIDAVGSLTNTTSHRRLYTYEPAGLRLNRVEVLVGSADVDSLRMDVVTDTAWELESQSSNWYAVKGGNPLTSAQLTRYRYDEHGRLSKVLLPGDVDTTPSTTVEFELADPSSRILITQRSSSSANDDVVEAKCLDGRGREFQRRQRLSATSWQVDGFVEFDSRGKTVRRYQPYLSTTGACETTPPANVPFTRFVFDPTGRMLRETEPDGSFRSTEYGPLVTRFFDEDDNDPADPQTNTPDVRTYDGLGRLTSTARQLTTGGPLSVNTFGYDTLGMLSTVRDPAGHVRTQTSDRFGRVVRIDDTNGGLSTLEFDAQSNLLTTHDARGTAVRQDYDGANRIVARFDVAADAATRVTYRYDHLPGCTECTNAATQIVQMTWPGASAGGEQRFGFDARGNPVYEQRIIAGHSFTTRHRFDAAMREIGVTHPDGTAIDTTLDGAGRPIAVSGAVTSAEYDERGEPSKLTFTNGTTSTYGYDGRLRLTSLKTTAPGGTLLDLGFTLSKSGDITAMSDGQLAGRLRRAGQHTIDGWGRMTRTTLTTSAGEETIDYGFDDIDNVTRAVSSLGAASRAHVGDFTYGKPNAVTNAGGMTLGYDAAGALTSRADATLTRDHRGRLVAASSPQLEATYTWDDLERVAKEEGDATTWYVAQGFEVRDGISVVYSFFDGMRVMRGENDTLAASLLSDLAPASGSGPLTVAGDSKIDIADAWLAQAASLNLVQLSGGPTPSDASKLLRSAARRLLMEDAVWLHRDNMNTALVATDSSGAVRGERSYYPTGILREDQGFIDSRGFTDQELDEATGLTHFKYRDFDARSGRWDRPDPSFMILSEDELTKAGEFNSGYAYVANQFSSAHDPTGLRLDRASFPQRSGVAARMRLIGRAEKGLKSLYNRAGAKLSKAGTAIAGAAKDAAAWANKKNDARVAHNEAIKANEFNHTPSKYEKAATIGHGLLTAASVVATLVNMIENLQGKTDEESGKSEGLQLTSSVLSGTSGVAGLANKLPALKRAAGVKSGLANGEKWKAIPSSSAPRRSSSVSP